MKTWKYVAAFILVFATGCSSIILKPADFSWPVESVVKVNNNGMAEINRYSLSFNAKMLFQKELGDSLAYQNQQLRVIRSYKGYYFMVAQNFKDVYVFGAHNGSLKLENKIQITDSTGMQDPAFNQRLPYIQLVYDNNKVELTEKGIHTEEVKK